jgi:phage-related protein (TIGR01555 family)
LDSLRIYCWEDKKAEDATKDAAKVIEKYLEKLHAESAFNLALKWKRLFGGALILIGAQDGSLLEEPLNINRIKDISDLKVIDRSEVDIGQSEFDVDETSPTFGQVIRFYIRFHFGSQTLERKVHSSRCIIFKGRPVPTNAKTRLTQDIRYWGMSEIQVLYDALRDTGGIFDSVSNIMYEFIIGKMKVEGLSSMMASEGGDKKIMKRMEITAMTKSILHLMMMDTTEDYTRDTAAIAGLAEIIDVYLMRVCGVSGVPMTRLFGRQSGGMNNNGEGEEGVYYDMIRSKQKTELKPAILRLLEIVQKVAGETIEDEEVKFRPLFQLSDLQKAQIKQTEATTEKTKADTYNEYVQMGVLEAEDVYKKEWEDDFGPRDFPEEEPPMPDILAGGVVAPNQIPTPNKPQPTLPPKKGVNGGK